MRITTATDIFRIRDGRSQRPGTLKSCCTFTMSWDSFRSEAVSAPALATGPLRSRSSCNTRCRYLAPCSGYGGDGRGLACDSVDRAPLLLSGRKAFADCDHRWHPQLASARGGPLFHLRDVSVVGAPHIGRRTATAFAAVVDWHLVPRSTPLYGAVLDCVH